MIKMLNRNARNSPIVCCDICGDMISDFNDGAAVFLCSPSGKVEVLHAHKDQCHDLAEQRLGDDSGWWELGQHLYLLVLNTGITPEKYKELEAQYRRLSDAGLY